MAAENLTKQYFLEKPEGRRWAIGDVHGFVNTFKKLVESKIGLTKQDQLILLGDLVDRGKSSKQLLDYLIDLKRQGFDVHCIRGNHDDTMVKAYREQLSGKKGFLFLKPRMPLTDGWLGMGGNETLTSFNLKGIDAIDPDYIEFLDSLPHYIETDKYFLVHAGFDFESEDPLTNTHAMMWIRHYAVDLSKTDGKKVVHGHTPLSFSFIQETIAGGHENFVPLDNGIYVDKPDLGSLLAYNLDSSELLVQAAID